MKVKSKVILFLFSFLFIFLSFSHFAAGQANVSRSPNLRSVSPRIAVDSAGNLHVVWAEYYSETTGDAFYARYNFATSVWETPENLSASGICRSSEYRPVGIDIDGSDNIYVVYVENSGTVHSLKLRIRSGGTWGAPFEVGTAGGEIDSARISVDSTGNIFTTWWVISSYNIFSRARIGGTWEAQQKISSGAGKFPNISVGTNMAYCVWMGKAPIYQTIYVRRNNSLGAAWSAPQNVFPYQTNSYPHDTPDVEVDSNDNANIAYAVVRKDVGTGVRQVKYTRWTGSAWTAAQTISTTTVLHYPSIHQRGTNSYVCWQLGAWGYGTAVNYNNRLSGAWTGIGAVANSSGVSFSDVATSPSQNQVYYVWDDIGLSGGSWEIYCNLVGGTGPPPPPLIFGGNDFDGDLTSDISVYRPTDGMWYVRNGITQQWGAPGDIPVQGYYDLNAITDIAIWRPSNGLWFISGIATTQWGTAGDLPVPRDYDGNGVTDLAVWRPSDGVWYVSGVGDFQLGQDGDYPMPGDYDGDNIDEIVVWRPSDSTWYIYGGGYFQWGAQGDIPVPADYNGDGTTDIAVYRPSTGMWYIWYMGGGTAEMQWGTMDDIPVPGDYNGDAAAEIAIWRPSDGLWYIYGVGIFQWGTVGDTPLVR